MAEATSSGRALIRVGALAAVAAGVLRAANALIPADPASTGLAVLYLVTDVGIVLGLIAWYFAHHARVRAWGSAGFVLGVVGVEVIRSAGAIPGVAPYPLGALLVGLGIDVLAICSWRAGRLPVWLPGLLVCSIVTGAAGFLVPGLSALFALSGLAFGVGFAGVGIVVWRDPSVWPRPNPASA